MEMWLLRHGTTDANQQGRFQGRLNYPLSIRGQQEAQLLANRLRGAGLEAILSSDLIRAWETAQIVGRGSHLSPIKEPLLRECSWGALEGLTWAEINEQYPGLSMSIGGKLKAGSVGGESERKLLARSRLLLKKVNKQYGDARRIALVSHSRFINALLAAALGLHGRQRWPFAPSPASLTIISFHKERKVYRLELFNDRCHIKESLFL